MLKDYEIKRWSLAFHESNFSQDDVIVYKEYPGLEVGDILEVYHEDVEFSRLLVRVNSLTPQQKGSLGISICKSLASSFHLRMYKDVCVTKVAKSDVTLDMIELVFKDDFVTRSDCWRLHQILIGSCVYFCNKLKFINMRVDTSELHMKGDSVACGVVGELTKIVYRSQSAKFHIMVQMSAEMWEFDFYGDLYFEKAIMGFLQDLFNKWKDKDMNCYHQVVLVLFSRTYYDAKFIDEFSNDMQKEVLCSRDGRFYKDFYKIIRQSEKQDNLQNVILDLKRSFHGYLHYVDCHQQFTYSNGQQRPKGLGFNSRAAEGNLLEAINLSLNVFEKQYIDCNLEETNCTTLIITPNTGVFEAEEELAMITKNRLIENAVGVDMVCLAEQPLHAVPLLKYSSKKAEYGSQYNIPQWINLSYYTRSSSKLSVFVPRMQVPPKPSPDELVIQRSAPCNMDYDEFDAQVFNYSKTKSKVSLSRSTLQTPPLSRSRMVEVKSVQSSPEITHSSSVQAVKKLSLQESGAVHHLLRSVSEDATRTVKHGSFDDLKFTMMHDDKDDHTPKLSSEHLLMQCFSHENSPNFKLGSINPFKPHHMANAITLFKYRWLHTFPLNLKGREHHLKVITENLEPETKSPAPEVEEAALATVEARKTSLSTSANDSILSSELMKRDNEEKCSNAAGHKSPCDNDWAATISTGVDWRSLCMPACLPLTIDYFPDETILKSLYNEYNYTMVIENDSNEVTPDSEKVQKEVGRFDRNAMPPEKKFMEMVSQRLTQGYQFVTNPIIIRILNIQDSAHQSIVFDSTKDYVLSLGWTIHRLKLNESTVQVTRYALREPEQLKSIHYSYNLWPHNCIQYMNERTEFSFQCADHYNWNMLDRYICETEKECTQYIVDGEKDIQLSEGMKYCRTRFLLLPVRPNPLETAPLTDNDVIQQIEGFLRFLEALNKIKRGSYNKELFSCRQKRTSSIGIKRKASQEQLNEKRSATPERSIERKESKVRGSPVQLLLDEQVKDAGEVVSSRSLSSLSGDGVESALTMTSSLLDIKKAMLNPNSGLYFLSPEDNYRLHTFISAEAVAWMIKSIEGCNTQANAVDLGQQLLDSQHILHASESSRQAFVDGFFLFFIKSEKREELPEKRRFWFGGAQKTDDELLTSYNIKWLEVSISMDQYDSNHPPFLQEKLTSETKSGRLYKTMEYNLDANEKSHRSEWCTIDYHGNFYPYNTAYAIQLNWMVATGCIIAELVQKLLHKATRCGVHIVPAPMCAFPARSDKDQRNPFRRSAFIRLNVESLLKDDKKHLFQEYEEETWPQRMLLFQQAILQRFDFLRDRPKMSGGSSSARKPSYQYIHSSGSVLIKINAFMVASDSGTTQVSSFTSPFLKKRMTSVVQCLKSDWSAEPETQEYGFYWVYNYALSKKWRTSYTGEVPSTKQFVAHFSDFCFNKDEQLTNFWNDAIKQTKKETVYSMKCHSCK